MTGQTVFVPGAGRLIGLDVGDRRIGVAVSDPIGILATPVEVYHRHDLERDVGHIQHLIAAEEARGAIIGLPINMNGSEGTQAEKVREFAGALIEAGIPVMFWDERLSTVEAERRMREAGRRKKRGVTQHNDAEAAAVILETYLDSVRTTAT